ncbi:ras-related protein Rab-34-like [Ptychodera flava]|uniref:ras-related protein Rab-34-like n=1 Tax=Ptychodera flava TaxID=63121 RepID=UPI00396A0067
MKQRDEKAARDRTVTRFPQAYNISGTPYKQSSFHPMVKNACAANKTGTVGLKISKCIVIGDVSVGKTCLVNRFCHQVFNRDYKATIGVDFEVERFDVLNVPFNLQIWDTAGQERFKCIAAAYYRGAHVIVVVFDLSDLSSLDHTSRWLEDATIETNNDDALVFLVGTKMDLCSQSKFAEIEEIAIEKAKELNAEYWSVSSKTGENVTEFFTRLAAMTFDVAVQKEVDDSQQPAKSIGGGSNLVRVRKPSDLTDQ